MYHHVKFQQNRKIRGWVISHYDLTLLNIERRHALCPETFRDGSYCKHEQLDYTVADLIIALKFFYQKKITKNANIS